MPNPNEMSFQLGRYPTEINDTVCAFCEVTNDVIKNHKESTTGPLSLGHFFFGSNILFILENDVRQFQIYFFTISTYEEQLCNGQILLCLCNNYPMVATIHIFSQFGSLILNNFDEYHFF
jgi:hypothetical protein